MSVHKNFINIINEDLKELVDNIINLDYNTLFEIFQILKIIIKKFEVNIFKWNM